MAIDPNELRRLIADYQFWTKKPATRFVCPILDREIDEAELMNGHILNEALEHVPKKKIIQYRRIDNFYGTKTEAAFVYYMNLPFMNEFERLKDAESVYAIMPDGSEVEVFFAKESSAFPAMEISEEDGTLSCKMYLRMPKNDPRLKDEQHTQAVPDRPDQRKVNKIPNFKVSEQFMPSQWAASALKAAYLTDFHLRGYEALLDPYRRVIREVLRDYFLSNGTKDECHRVFHRFGNALRLIAYPGTGEGFMPLPNTIEDRVALFHYTPDGSLFGASYLFPIRNVDFGVIMPQGNASSDMEEVMENYWNFVQTDFPERQLLRLAKYEYGTWHLGQASFIELLKEPTPALEAHLNAIVQR